MNYVDREDWTAAYDRKGLFHSFPPVIPFTIIDERIIDLALAFWNDVDAALMSGYRRLETIVRDRSGLSGSGESLFGNAFSPGKGPLQWPDASESVPQGRLQLFRGAYMAYRNHRAHHELKEHRHDALAEFLLLNHLFLLEAEARLTESIG